jgi:uncharacterized protein
MAKVTLHPAPPAGLHADNDASPRPFRYQPVRYFSLTFLVTFVLWFIGAYLSFQDDGSGLYYLVLLPGLLAPFLISLVFIFTSRNPDVQRDFRNRLLNPRLIRLDMLPAMLLLMPLAMLVSILLSLPLGGALEQFHLADGFSFSSGFVPVLLLLMMAATFEELGWRGYAFDSLESRYTYLTASLIFGVLWSLWHFPLIFVHNSYQYEIFQENIWFGVNFFVGIIPLGIIISWFCIKNGKSVIAAILFHFVINMSQEMLNVSQTTKCLETGVLTVVAIAIIIYDRELFFSKAHLHREDNK